MGRPAISSPAVRRGGKMEYRMSDPSNLGETIEIVEIAKDGCDPVRAELIETLCPSTQTDQTVMIP
jgi:hypothetical protein